MSDSNFRIAAASALAFAALVAWDVSGLDLQLAHAVGTAQRFPLREHWFLTQVMHSGAKALAWLAICLLCIAVTWPPQWLQVLPQRRRVQLAATALLGVGLVALVKSGSHTSCPWDLHEFGGIARYVSHWAGWMATDGGAGRCFPAGHASTGFAFVGGYFALRHHLPRRAVVWMIAALILGLLQGGGQQLRGAHFMSHTLWTGWICWMTAWLTDPLFARDRETPLGQATA